MKRILAGFMSLALLFTVTFNVSAEKTEIDLTRAEKFMIGSGIFSMEYKPDSGLSRAEFAAILSNALRLIEKEDKEDSWVGSETIDKDVVISDNLFLDVDTSHPYYNEIQAIRNKKIMVGVSQNLFAPEYSITLKEAQKVLLSLMGYDIIANVHGGYPDGYAKVAEDVGLLDGVSCGNDDVITHKDVVKLFYNAMDINLVEVGNITTKDIVYSDETFMTGVLKMGKERGILSDNGYTAVDDDSEIGCGKIKVNSTVVKLTPNTITSTKFLGRQVEVYYYQSELDENIAVYVEEMEDSETITFDIDDFVTLENNQITFTVDGRTYQKALNKNAEMIMNNELVEVFSKETFDFADGDVTLINNDSGYKTLVVNKYEYAVINAINSEDKIIFNRLKGKEVSSEYDFSGKKLSEDAIVILDFDGNSILFDELKVGDTLNIKRSANFMEVIRANTVVSDMKFSGISTEKEYSLYESNNTEYKTSESYDKLSNKKTILLSQPYEVYFNIFGDIIWIETKDTSNVSERMGVLLRADILEDENGEPLRYIKIYSDDADFEKHYVDERIKINGKQVKFLVDGAPNSILKDAIGEVILYNTDENGVLIEMTIAGEYGSNDAEGWYRVAPDGTYRYESNGHAFSTNFFIPDSYSVFEAPASESKFGNVENFSYNSAGFINNEEYNIQAYSRNKDNILADIVLVRLPDSAYDNGSGTSMAYAVNEGEAFLISEIATELDENEEIITKAKGYYYKTASNPQYREFIITDKTIMVGFGKPAEWVGKTDSQGNLVNKTYKGPMTPAELEAGDVIYFNVNAQNELRAIRIAYDYSEKKPYNGGDGTDFYNSTGYGTARNTTWAGTLMSVYGKGIKFATNHNPAGIDPTNHSEYLKNTKTSEIRNPANITIVEKKGKKVSISLGSLSDLVTYNKTGSNAYSDDVVVLTYMRSLNYGTIIYKK